MIFSKELNLSVKALLEPYVEKRPSFELFKSNVCHQLKLPGDIEFLIDALEKDDIHRYYKKKWYPECFYLPAVVDYVSRVNNVAICEEYNQIRKLKLQNMLYPTGVLAFAAVSSDRHVKEEAVKNAIPEFLRFNIVENEVRNVN